MMDFKVYRNKEDPKFKCSDILDNYANSFIIAMKKSGKTNLLINLLLKSIGKSSKVILISSTLINDPTYDTIRKELNKQKIKLFEFDTIPYNLIDIIKEYKDDEYDPKLIQKKLAEIVPITHRHLISSDLIKKIEQDLISKNEPKKTKNYSEWVIILDDMGDMARNNQIAQLLRTNRHYHSKVFILSQYVKDITPASIQNVNHVFLGHGIGVENIIHILEKMGFQGDKKAIYDLYEQYKELTKNKYSFVKIDAGSFNMCQIVEGVKE